MVVAAGDDGVATNWLTMPAMNPNVITVGAADSNSTDGKTDDLVSTFSSGGNATRHPDLLALGRSVVSLRDPNSNIDVTYPRARIPTDAAQRYFRGSGTSQAAAVVSGAVALLLQQRPTLTPDQVKRLLTNTATKLDPTKGPLSSNVYSQGAGELDLEKALDAPAPTAVAAAQTSAPSLGTGTLDASRGTAVITDPETGIELHGERDIQGQLWQAATWSKNASAGTAWSGGIWNGRTWSGAAWTGANWNDAAWSGTSWSGTNWAGRSWTDNAWLNGTWTGRSWTGRSWTGAYWTGTNWR